MKEKILKSKSLFEIKQECKRGTGKQTKSNYTRRTYSGHQLAEAPLATRQGRQLQGAPGQWGPPRGLQTLSYSSGNVQSLQSELEKPDLPEVAPPDATNCHRGERY